MVEGKLEVLFAQVLESIYTRQEEYDKLLEDLEERGDQVSWEDADHGTYLEGILEGFWEAVRGLGGINLQFLVRDHHTLLYENKDKETQIREQNQGDIQVQPGENGG